MNTRSLVLVCLAALCTACGGNGSGGGGSARHLYYEGQSGGATPGFEIWDVVVANGEATGAPANLTNSLGDDMEADWNQQEQKIAFASDRTGDFNIYVMNADGSNVIQVTSDTHMQRLPSWDKTGNQIAFATDEDSDFEIFVVRPNGNNPRQLTHNDCVDSDPAWSPDGAKIAYVTNCDSTSDLEIHVMDFDGTNDQRLTNRPATDDFHPAWSPDSLKIAFESVPGGGSAHVNTEISIMNADGTGLTTLTIDASTRDLILPAWAPGADELAVARIDATGDYNLYMISTSGGTASRMLDQPLTQWAPVWGAPAP